MCRLLSGSLASSVAKRKPVSSGQWLLYGLGLKPTPLAVGENWDSPEIPDFDPRWLVLAVAGVAFVGLGVSMWRGRTPEG